MSPIHHVAGRDPNTQVKKLHDPDWESRGRRFKSGQPDQRNPCLGGGFSRFRVELDHGAGAGVEQTWSTFAQKEAVPGPIWLVPMG